ncbi:hypothetical protein F383_35349 [Gossypium arboreum]|uniref:Uncharacterized protein n=1 Tax=Gossypium arboreum TaxID=29729 RepID=A0A0B0N8M6_GOSAR|nr:hypothetical protein F383_35349 [Gossypium arboreum]
MKLMTLEEEYVKL